MQLLDLEDSFHDCFHEIYDHDALILYDHNEDFHMHYSTIMLTMSGQPCNDVQTAVRPLLQHHKALPEPAPCIRPKSKLFIQPLTRIQTIQSM